MTPQEWTAPELDRTARWSERPLAMGLVFVGLLVVAAALALAGGSVGVLLASRLLLGLAASLAIGWAGWQRGWLTTSGVLGAVLTGTLIVAGGGLTWGALLVFFFVSASLLSRWQRRRKATVSAMPAKGARRDLGQVLANGAVAALLAVLAAVWPAPVIAAAFIGALATVTADTWSSELGVLSRRPPRLLPTGRPVPTGTNGAVSLLGTSASLAGGLALGIVAMALGPTAATLGELALPSLNLPWLGLVAGAGGSLVDSVLGATVQGVRSCPTCAVETEAERHTCGTATRPARGWAWLDNDRVNLIASLAGAVIAATLWLAL